jgi:toxin ParE1/3/4
MLIENCGEVANNPDLGKDYSAIAENLLGFKAGRHIIFYRRIEENEVEIIRILHEKMDLKNRMDE